MACRNIFALHFYAVGFQKIKISEAALLPQALPLTDPPRRRDSIKKRHAFAWLLCVGKAYSLGSVGCLCTASTKKINSRAMLAELYFFCCLRCWLFTHNVHYRTFFRACPAPVFWRHKQSQKVRSEPIMPHYVNIASGSFFWRGFLLRGVGCTCLFFLQIPFKNNSFVCKKIK